MVESMKIKIIGAGFYGCHLALSLLNDGHDVVLHEKADDIFTGASGSIPARIHRGFHYPRSLKTRLACNEHYLEFMEAYGEFTHGVPVNIYAIARDASMVDFGTYKQVLDGQVQYIEIEKPEEYGVRNVEGAILTGERHIITDEVRRYFRTTLAETIVFNRDISDSEHYDLVIDATFCALDNINIDRYEPCLVLRLKGPTDKAITIMDGPFPSLYPWNENEGTCSLSSAQWTPFSKTCETWDEAHSIISTLSVKQVNDQAFGMIDSMRNYYPAIDAYEIEDHMLSIRAMPLSGSDARLVDVVKTAKNTLRIRAGKIDAVIQAEREIKGYINDWNNRSQKQNS